MKKNLLLTTALLFGAFATNAQISITMADVASPITVIQQSARHNANCNCWRFWN